MDGTQNEVVLLADHRRIDATDKTVAVQDRKHVVAIFTSICWDVSAKDALKYQADDSVIRSELNGDTSGVVTGSAAFTGNATGAMNAGTYTITPTQGTLAAANYDFPVANFVNGSERRSFRSFESRSSRDQVLERGIFPRCVGVKLSLTMRALCPKFCIPLPPLTAPMAAGQKGFGRFVSKTASLRTQPVRCSFRWVPRAFCAA